MLHSYGLTLYEPNDLDCDTATPAIADLRQITTWAVEVLCSPNPQLGRTGPVCPYTRPSMNNHCFLLAWASGEHDIRTTESTADRYRRWFMELLEQSERARQHLLTILVVLPAFDRTDPGPLDELQARLKEAFVREGLMIGQFHPHCEQSGLWNENFRPLKAPIPLLAIRRMVPSDLPFLLDSGSHLSAYLDRFAPDIPPHIRRFLIARITKTTGQHMKVS